MPDSLPDHAIGAAAAEDEAMFPIGQKVWHRDGRRSGTVLECDGDRVYIEQDNGAELDFPASELSTTPPEGGKASVSQAAALVAQAAAQTPPQHILIAADITPEHVRVLGLIPARTLQAIAALYEKRPGRGRFSALDVAGKLNVIVEISGVPFRTLRDYSDRPGELGLLMGKGIADSGKAAG
jgi:hypothetical protein